MLPPPGRTGTGFAEAALVEPWTCVIASYQIPARTKLKEKGHLHVAGFPHGQVALYLEGLDASRVATVSHEGLSPENIHAVEELARKMGATLVADRKTGDGKPGPSDIICAWNSGPGQLPQARRVDRCRRHVGVHSSEPDVELPVDVGKVHYRKIELVGSTDGRVAASYTANNRESLVPGGRAWFVGGAAPWVRCTSSRPSWTSRGLRTSSSRTSPTSGLPASSTSWGCWVARASAR